MAEEFASLVEAFKNVGVSRAYGAAVQIAGEEIIPVALVTFGFGGGSSPDDGSGGEAAAGGGGGGGCVLPLGVYGPGKDGHVVFRPNTVAVLAGLVPLACALGFAVRGVVRAVKA
ncbi:hypothetical protein [Pseudarthrobacter albicanus]|uniref:hypothetical protein n=1 Tax=Pseudarthrobacter albicanus TaxID=2823873 RepID=UPI001BA7D82B|nr:hypothetical protein [Pseudarthrobacter albicanus]